MDFDFAYNPSGVHARTVGDLMHGNGLEHVLERFAAMIQSGKDIFLDNITLLTMYTFSPITGGARQMDVSTTKTEFIERSPLLKLRIMKTNHVSVVVLFWV